MSDGRTSFVVALVLGALTLAAASPLAPRRAGSSPDSDEASSQGPDAPRAAARRRALLVGVNAYGAVASSRSDGCDASGRGGRSGARPAGESRAGFSDLEGPVNDVCALAALLETPRYGFEGRDVEVLLDGDATRGRILKALERLLVEDARRGDFLLFYFAGHGSQVKNSLGGEYDGLDETLMPSDATRPVAKREELRDIRDKELARLYNSGLDRGVVLTVVSDSCHSGSNSRGLPQRARARSVAPVTAFDVKDGGAREPAPEERGALVLSASKDYQTTEEHERAGRVFGDFSWNLLKVLGAAGADDLSASALFQQVTARMRADGLWQEPVLAGTDERRRRTLFGREPSARGSRPLVAVSGVDSKTGLVDLQGGLLNGLYEGSELRGVGVSSRALKLRVVESSEPLRCRARVVAQQGGVVAAGIRAGDLFEQESWTAPREPFLRVWMPPATLREEELSATAAELDRLRGDARVRWVEDPTRAAPTHVLSFDGKSWILSQPGGGATLGTRPTAKDVLSKLKTNDDGRADLFVSLPPSSELASAIRLGAGTSRSVVEVTRAPAEATYQLVGRAAFARGELSGIEYAWVLPAAPAGAAAPRVGARPPSGGPEVSPLPAATDWLPAARGAAGVASCARGLEDFALRLSRVRGWLTLSTPPGGDAGFQYKLVVKDGGDAVVGERLLEGRTYCVALQAEREPAPEEVRERWVYVFSIDSVGSSSLIYPREQEGARLPRLAPGGGFPREIQLGCFRVTGPDLDACAVLGAENYVLLTTAESIADPYALEFQGVSCPTRSAGAQRSRGPAPASGLESLLHDLGETTRSRGPLETPLNWSVQHLFYRSVPR